MDVVSRQVGVSVATLERWRAEALANAAGKPGGGGNPRWTAAARLEAVIATAAMDEASRSTWCREQGLYAAELDGWKQDAIAGLGEPPAGSAAEVMQERRRIKELKRALQRKDKALAETAALLVLSKKLSAVFHTGEQDGRMLAARHALCQLARQSNPRRWSRHTRDWTPSTGPSPQ